MKDAFRIEEELEESYKTHNNQEEAQFVSRVLNTSIRAVRLLRKGFEDEGYGLLLDCQQLVGEPISDPRRQTRSQTRVFFVVMSNLASYYKG